MKEKSAVVDHGFRVAVHSLEVEVVARSLEEEVVAHSFEEEAVAHSLGLEEEVVARSLEAVAHSLEVVVVVHNLVEGVVDHILEEGVDTLGVEAHNFEEGGPEFACHNSEEDRVEGTHNFGEEVHMRLLEEVESRVAARGIHREEAHLLGDGSSLG